MLAGNDLHLVTLKHRKNGNCIYNLFLTTPKIDLLLPNIQQKQPIFFPKPGVNLAQTSKVEVKVKAENFI